MKSTPIVELHNITKRFPGGVLANDRVSLDLRQGEILGLLGENGAGKTTLMNILYGLYRPDEGEIRLRGAPVHFHSPHDAIAHGLGMVHQHFMLVPKFTVAENLMLGQPSPRAPLLADRRAVAQRILDLSAQYGLQVDPHAPVWQLSVGQEQRVEILKTLYRGAEILILDEPTAVLTPQEVDELLAILRNLAADGRSIIFISHKLREVMEVCDRIAVMRDGRLVDVVLTAQTTTQALSRMMVGREVMLRVDKAPATPGEVLLRIQNLHAKDDRGLPALRGVNLTVRAGEIVGVAGVEGNGQRELEETLRGLRPVSAGRIELCGRDVTGRAPRDIIDAGLGHVPSDRYRTGLLRDFSVAENLALVTVDRPPFTRRGLLDMAAMRSRARQLVQAFDVRTPSVDVRVAALSGGNAQKVVLAREIAHGPRVLLVAQPTRGVDVGAIEYVHRELVRRRDEGMAILLISTELDEILALSDRIVVLYQGRIVGECPAEGVSVEALGLMMGGTPSHAL
ncbi:ABC transporter ATP-binding protein [Caldilinea sp.]|uniref:ABC transporter ATP-binding protein n=1 Tax=Caldilinea sp. TaxID=2293560 RepID=UPI0021DE0F03|nr:ABC transporter ATP-binding protein [Caldilinea sp.]GIV67255.1 MAG: ABC transporter [Caldilinea sp.]GIV82804.1 MAG: ABC transporter [Anaerolineae bacterium]